jgi:protein phosphatase
VSALAELRLDVGVSTDVGLKRAVNEDSVIAQGRVFAVADGMGGHDAGDRASQAVVSTLRELADVPEPTADDVTDAISRAQQRVRLIADETSRGAGSTLTGAVVVEQAGRAHWLVMNVGDSRVYRLRDGVFEQLTIDHSLAQELIDEGQLTRADLPSYRGKNVITRAIGADDSPADLWLYPIVAGEVLLMCSDGLTGEVAEPDIQAILASRAMPQAIADRLVSAALAGGGRDNVTVLVVAVAAGGIPSALDEQTAVVAAEVDELEDVTIELPRKPGARSAI